MRIQQISEFSREQSTLQTRCLQMDEKILSKLVSNFPCRNPGGKEESLELEEWGCNIEIKERLAKSLYGEEWAHSQIPLSHSLQ